MSNTTSWQHTANSKDKITFPLIILASKLSSNIDLDIWDPMRAHNMKTLPPKVRKYQLPRERNVEIRKAIAVPSNKVVRKR